MSVLLGCFAVYHEQKYTVSQHLKILSSLDPLRHSVPTVQYMYVRVGGSGCRGSVAEHWRLKLEVSWV